MAAMPSLLRVQDDRNTHALRLAGVLLHVYGVSRADVLIC